MQNIKILASAILVPIVLGTAALAPVSAAPASPAQLKLLTGNQSAKSQKVHCRRFIHVHPRCVVWRGGLCRRWVRYRHRCG